MKTITSVTVGWVPRIPPGLQKDTLLGSGHCGDKFKTKSYQDYKNIKELFFEKNKTVDN